MDDERRGTALRALVAAASVVVVIAGLKAAGQVLLPIVFSAFLAIATLPAVLWLRRRGVPNVLAIVGVVVLVAGLLAGLSGLVAGAVRTFTADIGKYQEGFDHLTQGLVVLVDGLGFDVREADLSDYVTPEAIMGLVQTTIESVIGLLGRLIIVLVTLTFILLEASELEQKLRVAFSSGDLSELTEGPFAGAGSKVQRYLVIKTLMSLLTGIAAGLGCSVVGVDFWLVWGLLAFLLNYIPSIGGFVAAIPPILLATVQLGWPYALAVALIYSGIHVLIGNLMEPRLMGQSLGLSPLVVFLSLLFWGWMWGPLGMLLCVPMTVMAKLVLESRDDTRWIAVLLGPPREARHGTSRVPRTLPG